ncbi:MAG: Hsp20/alpha crystallin family protein [Anaerolineales bacterium]|nr:Hsp20/alpha crystallin family protein [Anaerolineales bacterium]
MYRRFQRPSIWQEMDQLQREMNRLFDATSKGRVFNSPSYPAINIWTNEDGQVISAEMPGVHPDDIDIDVTGDALSISGERKPDEVARDARYHRRERSCGSFSRTIQLPFIVDTSKVEASFKNGVLLISLPRAEADKPKKITIKSK